MNGVRGARGAVALLVALLVSCGGKNGYLPTALDPAQLERIIETAARTASVPAALILAVIEVESSGNPRAVNATGSSQGLMQLTHGTALAYGDADRFDPVRNVTAGALYLHDLLTRYHGDVGLALAAWNIGPSAVDRAHGIPAPARPFVTRVLNAYRADVSLLDGDLLLAAP